MEIRPVYMEKTSLFAFHPLVHRIRNSGEFPPQFLQVYPYLLRCVVLVEKFTRGNRKSMHGFHEHVQRRKERVLIEFHRLFPQILIEHFVLPVNVSEKEHLELIEFFGEPPDIARILPFYRPAYLRKKPFYHHVFRFKLLKIPFPVHYSPPIE